MIGCLLGIAGAFAFVRLAARHRMGGCGPHGWHRAGGCGSFGPWSGGGRGHGHGPWGDQMGDGGRGGDDGRGGGDGEPWSGRHRGGRGFVLAALGERLGTTPEQDKVLRDAFEEMKDVSARHRGELRRTRADIAGALRKPSFDEVAMGELYARHDTVLEDLRKTAVGVLARSHDALDERQRARLADLVESGPGFFGRWA